MTAEATLLEMVELSNGDVVLRKVESQDAPLITITFSAESEQLLANAKLAIAGAMIEAGIQAYAEMAQPIPQTDTAILH